MSDSISNIYFPISNKRYEVTFSLFTKCNLNCDFCFQSHTNDIDIEAIKNIPKLLEDNYPDELKDQELENIRVNITGGEIFSDDIDDIVFDAYRIFFNDTVSIIRSYLPNVQFEVSWVTNGVHTNNERIMKLFNDTALIGIKTFLGLSYDPIGRFKTKDQFKLFENTFWYFYNNYKVPPMIGYTLTKKNIESFIRNDDKFVDSLPKDVLIDICYYVSNSNWKVDQPTEDDLYNFFIWGINNDKFKIDGINILLETIYLDKPASTACTCRRLIGYSNKKFAKDCGLFSLPYEHYFGNHTKDITPDNITEMKCLVGIEKCGCLMCEYKNVCTGPCWCSILFDKYEIKECFLKRIIKYLYDNPQIADRYKEYKENLNE